MCDNFLPFQIVLFFIKTITLFAEFFHALQLRPHSFPAIRLYLFINAYKKILDDLGEILKRENITEAERERITKNMIDIADRIAAKDTEETDL
mgnify:CR=1 FL=1